MTSSSRCTPLKNALPHAMPSAVKADGFVGAPGAMIVREKTNAEPVGVGLDEKPIDSRRQQHSAVALSWCRDGDALDQRHAFGGGPLAKDDEADRH